MEWYHAPETIGTFLINGSGLFTGEADIELGKLFVESMLNDGFHVTCGYGDYEGEEAMEVRFTTEPNSFFIG